MYFPGWYMCKTNSSTGIKNKLPEKNLRDKCRNKIVATCRNENIEGITLLIARVALVTGCKVQIAVQTEPFCVLRASFRHCFTCSKTHRLWLFCSSFAPVWWNAPSLHEDSFKSEPAPASDFKSSRVNLEKFEGLKYTQFWKSICWSLMRLDAVWASWSITEDKLLQINSPTSHVVFFWKANAYPIMFF